MTAHWQPPPRRDERQAFEAELARYLAAFGRWHFHGRSVSEARQVLVAETERLRLFDKARQDGLIE